MVHRAVRRLLEPLLDGGSGLPGYCVLSGFDSLHVDAHAAVNHDAELGRTMRHVRGVRAGDHGLGGNAACVHARAAKKMALDDCHLHASRRQTLGQRRAGLACADDDSVIRSAHKILPSSLICRGPVLSPFGPPIVMKIRSRKRGARGGGFRPWRQAGYLS